MLSSAKTDKTKGKIEAMFDDIAPTYDLLNHLLSANTDKLWRTKAVSLLKPYSPKNILDMATGTADFLIALTKLKPEKITGIDISPKMLEIGQKKVAGVKPPVKVELLEADALNLPFPDSCFDAVTVAFGIRNFEDLSKGFSEVFRVLKVDGKFLILEFSKPSNPVFRKVFNLYFGKALPALGKVVSRNVKAYRYLFKSVQDFPGKSALEKLFLDAGFRDVRTKTLSLGIVTIYLVSK